MKRSRKTRKSKSPSLNCPYCFSERTVLRGFRKNRGMVGSHQQAASLQKKQLFLCKSCGRKFTEDDGYLRMRFPSSIIREAVSLSGKGYSSAEVRTHLERKGIRVSRWTVLKWARRFGH